MIGGRFSYDKHGREHPTKGLCLRENVAMATPRYKLIDAEQPMYYHLVSNCVKGMFLCGYDPVSGRDFEHRKGWIEDRLLHLAKYFAVEISAYAVMSNHLHMVVYYDPKASMGWSDEEVAQRWTLAQPRFTRGKIDENRTARQRDEIANNPDVAAAYRAKLGSVSTFMKLLKQPIASRANKEIGENGSFWEKRFYSGAILDDAHLVAAMAYVDLNPVRAGVVRSYEEARHTSVRQRLKGYENTAERLQQFLEPVVSGLKRGNEDAKLPLRLIDYLTLVASMTGSDGGAAEGGLARPHTEWGRRMDSFKLRHRAYGAPPLLLAWLEERNFSPVELRVAA